MDFEAGSPELAIKSKYDIEKLIGKITNFKDEKNQNLLAKFSVKYLISIIEKDKITDLEKRFLEYDKNGVDVIDFVRIFLNLIEHLEHETIYLVMSLIDLFRMISEEMNMASFIKYADVTDIICSVI